MNISRWRGWKWHYRTWTALIIEFGQTHSEAEQICALSRVLPPSLSPELGWTKETASKQVTSHNRWERGPVSLIIAFKWRQAHIIAFKYFPKTDGKYCIEIGTRPIITGKCTNLWVLHQNLSKYVVHLSPLWSYCTGRSWFWCLGPGDMICHGDLTHFLWIPLWRR